MSENDFTEYVQQTAVLMGLSLNPEYLPLVVDNFQTIAAIASLVLEFPLPENIEPAPEFNP